jgi:chitodextrinase
MAISRRTVLRTAAALAAVSVADLSGLARPAFAASPVGDVVGKISVGYQGWFACIGDGSPINGWWHWANNWGQAPSPSNTAIVSWPDVREYANTYRSAYANLGNGGVASLFSHYDQQTVDTHFGWMRDYGCDTAALQRFNPTGGEGPIRDAITAKVRSSAENFGRKFYIMYDVTNWTSMQSDIKTDWSTKMSAYISSSAYARQNGKPVVCIWGFGFNDPARPFDPGGCLDVVNWFKGQGCYVIGGVPTYWRQGINDSRSGFLDVYHAFNMISPWMIGRTGDLAGLDWFYTNVNVPDQADCNANGIDYQPCVMPGDLSAGVRRHGDFFWRHFYNMVRLGCQGLYISMFDEFNEGNQIAKTAESAAMQPTNFPGRALDEDGTACSSDYYLRITTDGGRMLKGQLALTAVRPTRPTTGGTTPVNLAAGRPTAASSALSGYPTSNAVDADPNSYWESTNNVFPQWLQVDLGSVFTLGTVILRLPPNSAWASRVQTLSVLTSADGSSFATAVGATGYTFDSATGNSVTITLPANTTGRFVQLNITANTGWPAAQISQFEVWGSTVGGGDMQPPSAPTNLTSPAKTANSASLSWTASTDNVGVAGYQVLVNRTAVGTTASTSFTVSSLSAATAYTFTVKAYDAAGNYSAASAPLTVTTNAAPNTNLALNRPTTDSGHTQTYVSGNAVDGDPNSYWESVDNAFPQWLQVDLGSATSVARIVLKLPPSPAWGARTQTLTMQGSNDGSSFATVVGSAGYTFDPTTGNTVTITFAATTTRYVRLTFTANTGWPAGQAGEFEIYAS